MRGESLPALDGLRQEKFKLSLPTDPSFYLKSARGISQSGTSLTQSPRAVKFEIIPFEKRSPFFTFGGGAGCLSGIV